MNKTVKSFIVSIIIGFLTAIITMILSQFGGCMNEVCGVMNTVSITSGVVAFIVSLICMLIILKK